MFFFHDKWFLYSLFRRQIESSQRRLVSATPDWTENAVVGDHLWVPSSISGDFCYAGDSECTVIFFTCCYLRSLVFHFLRLLSLSLTLSLCGSESLRILSEFSGRSPIVYTIDVKCKIVFYNWSVSWRNCERFTKIEKMRRNSPFNESIRLVLRIILWCCCCCCFYSLNLFCILFFLCFVFIVGKLLFSRA